LRALGAAAALLWLNACAGGSLQPSPPVQLAPDAAFAGKKSAAVLYVSDEGNPNVVNIFSQANLQGAPIGQITSGLSTPDGMVIDTTGNLYVANAGNDTVAVYAPGATTPFKTYTQGMATPANVAIGNDGTLFVVNLNGGSEFINEYAPGSMSPTLNIPAPYYENGMAVDPSGNLYVAYHDSSGHGWVYKYPAGSTDGTNLSLAVHTPAGLTLDKKGNLIVADATLPAAILVFKPGKTQPSRKVTNGVGNPFLSCLDKAEKHYFVTDSYPAPEGIDVFTYPKLEYLYRITNSVQVPAGCVADPTAPI
jgi:sugar lactone lactonase YvrE